MSEDFFYAIVVGKKGKHELGLALTDDVIAEIEADPSKLRYHIDSIRKAIEWSEKNPCKLSDEQIKGRFNCTDEEVPMYRTKYARVITLEESVPHE